MSDLRTKMDGLASAEEFLEFFDVAYDETVVRVNRLHILQRFHDYIALAIFAEEDAVAYAQFAQLLNRAYQDFVHSDARAEKVFKVFRHDEPSVTFVPLAGLSRSKP